MAMTPDDEPTRLDTPARKPLWRRALKWLGIVALVVLVLVLIVVGLLHTGPGKEFVRDTIEERLADRFDGTVSLGGVDYAIFGDVELSDLSIKDKEGKTVVGLQHALVSPEWVSLLSGTPVIDKLVITGLALDLVRYEDGTTNLDRMRRGEPPEFGRDGITLKDIDVSKVSVRILQPDGTSSTLDDLTVAGFASYDKAARTARVDIKTLAAQLTVDVPQRLKMVMPLSTSLSARMDGDTAVATLAPIRTSASLTRAGQPAVDVPIVVGGLEAKRGVELLQLALTGVEAGPLTLSGLTADARLDPDGRPRGEQALRLTGLTVSGVEFNRLLGQEVLRGDVTADIGVSGPLQDLDVKGRVDTTGGVLTLTGSANASNLERPAYDLKLVGSDINSRKLLVGERYPDVKTGMTVTVKGEGVTPGASRVDISVEVDKTVVDGRIVDRVSVAAKTRGAIVTLDNVEVSAFGQTLGLTGQLDRDKRLVTARIKTRAGLAQVVANARESGVMLPPLPSVDGTLDVDISLDALLKPEGVEAVAAAGPAPLQLQQLPFETARIKGFVRGDKVTALDRSFALLDLTMDVALTGQTPMGEAALKVRDATIDGQHYDAIDVQLDLDGFGQTITASVRDAGQKLAVDAVANALVDLDARRVVATVDSLKLKKGRFDTTLLEPVTMVIDTPSPKGSAQTLTLPRTRLAMAGGSMVLDGRVTFTRLSDNPAAQQLEAMQATIELRGLSLGRLASIARRRTGGLRGTLSGRLTVDGTPDDPEVDFDVAIKARAPGASPALVKAGGAIIDRRLRADVKVTDAASKALLAQLKLAAPLALQPRPGLAPGGRLDLTLDVPRRRLDAFGALMPQGLPPGTDPAATVTAHARMAGSTSRPRGDFGLTLEGRLLRAGGLNHMPARQRFAVRGEVRPEGQRTALDAQLSGWLDADAEALVTLAVNGRFERSPLLRSGMRKPWTLAATLAPLDLSRVPRPQGEAPLAGSVDAALALEGDATDLLGRVQLGAQGVTMAEGAPKLDAATLLTLGERSTEVDVDVTVGGLDALSLDGTIALPGKGLRRLVEDRRKLGATPLKLVAEVPRKSLKTWSDLSPAVAGLPGDVGGRFEVGGTLAAPTATGALAYDGFETLSGGQGRVALQLDAGLETIAAGLVVGQGPGEGGGPVSAIFRLDRAQLANPESELVATLRARAKAVDLLTLVPAFAIGQDSVDVAGVLDWTMDGEFRVARGGAEARLPKLLPGSTLLGDFVLREGRVGVPNTGRTFEDVRVKLTSSAEALEIVSVHAREGDVQKQQRTLDMSGRLDWQLFQPQRAVLDVKTHDWLVLGNAFDGPEGELGLDMRVTATALTAPIKDIDVHIKAVELNAPERFIRAHYQQHMAHDDVIFLDESHLPSGKLPTDANTPRAAAPGLVDPSDARLASAAATEPEAPPGGVDIHLRIPEAIDLGMFPLDLRLKGGFDVELRGKELAINGGLDVLSGSISAMGQIWDLETGVIEAGGGLESVGAELKFSRYPHHTALRDVSLPSGNDGKVFIIVRADVAKGLTTEFGGAGGPTLLDAATVQNTGRTRIWGRADLPASENVQFGPPGHGLVNTFLQTNMRNLIFMDRANGWSDPVDDRRAYGRITNFRAQRFINDDTGRISFLAQPPAIGKNVMELHYDWILAASPRTVVGTGFRLGDNLRLGWGLSFEYASED